MALQKYQPKFSPTGEAIDPSVGDVGGASTLAPGAFAAPTTDYAALAASSPTSPLAQQARPSATAQMQAQAAKKGGGWRDYWMKQRQKMLDSIGSQMAQGQ